MVSHSEGERRCIADHSIIDELGLTTIERDLISIEPGYPPFHQLLVSIPSLPPLLTAQWS